MLNRQKKILLASNSPRRRELLRLILPEFEIVRTHDIVESYPETLSPKEVPLFLSKLKAKAYSSHIAADEIIITADTVVINDGRILGKPHSEDEAFDMLCSLMGKTHIVVTGVTLTSIDKTFSFSETTDVTFDSVSQDEVKWYVKNYRPYDKAGAYGIQEWIGCIGIKEIKGCFYNVMGLPLHSLYMHLRTF